MPRIIKAVPARMYDKRLSPKRTSRTIFDGGVPNYAALPQLYLVRKDGVTLDVLTTINDALACAKLSMGRKVFVLKNGTIQGV